MRAAWKLRLWGILFGLAACQPLPSQAAFDYWVLALSWSPEFCASDAARPDSKQCARPREFVVHGLWPQYERGHPEYCDNRTGVPIRIADRVSPLMPDRGLVFHQWKKHGSCSGLSIEDYFVQLERAAADVLIPRDTLARAATKKISRLRLEREFLVINPRLSAPTISFACKDDYLREVRICLDRDLRPRGCGPDVRESCPREIFVRPMQGDRK